MYSIGEQAIMQLSLKTLFETCCAPTIPPCIYSTQALIMMIMTLLGCMQKEKAEASTLRNLSAYLTLSKARDTYGFQPEKYGLSDKDAAEIASIFSKYDVNDDMRLEELELRRLA